MREKDDEADRHEQDRAQPRLAQSPEPQPQPERDQRERHRQCEIDEAEHERMTERQRQREGDGGRKSVMNLARDPQHSRDGERRDHHHDQLGRRLDPDQLGERDGEQIDPEIADRHPAERIPLRQIGARRAIGGDLEPPHVPRQVDQRLERRIEHRNEGEQDHRRDEQAAFPPWARARRRRGGGLDQPRSRRPSGPEDEIIGPAVQANEAEAHST